MKLSTRTRYGMRAIIEIAMHSSDTPILLKDICKKQNLSLKYIDQIITSLKSAGLVVNAGGKHSGYLLARPLNKIYASEIVASLEGGLSVRECVDIPGLCERSEKCISRKLWKKLDSAIQIALNVTLSELIKEQRELEEKREVKKCQKQ